MSIQLSAEELYFIDTYIFPNRRERLKYELTSAKKRYDGIDRFCHSAREMLKPAFLTAVIVTAEKFLIDAKNPNSLRKIDSNPVFVISVYKDLDRQVMPFCDAVDKMLGLGSYILIDRKLQFAFVETEPDCPQHEYLYLQK